MFLKKIRLFFYLLQLYGCFIRGSNAQTREGDRCLRQYDRISGTCKLLNQCPKVVTDYQVHNIQPQYCQFSLNKQIVCCPTNNFSENDITTYQSEDRKSATAPTLDTLIQNVYAKRNGDGSNRQDYARTNNYGRDTVTSVSTERQKRTNEQRISLQKCEDYKKLSKKVIVFSPLIIDPTPIRKEIQLCDTTTPLIVGGDVAKPGEFPSMAVLGYTNTLNNEPEWKCGGTLISDRFILTAAHCAQSSDRPTIVRLGEQNLATVNDGAYEVDYDVEQIFIHPNYKKSSNYFDIALIRLRRNVEFTSQIRPACLWQNDYINATKAIATGWGQTAYLSDEVNSQNLLKVDLNLYSNQQCQQYYSALNNRKLKNGIVNEQLCAGHEQQDKDTCQGDSGGPLYVIFSDNPCTHHLVGVTSFGSGCGNGALGVYTRISSYLDWIESIVW